MPHELGNMYAGGLMLFSKTNRLISHELKNVLAIFSETLGLVDELMDHSTAGRSLTPEKLRALNESMMEEVVRANRILRNMNTFAHTVDSWLGNADVGQLLRLMIDLLQLDAAARNARIGLDVPQPCVIESSPFFLADLMFCVLRDALRWKKPGHDVSIFVSANGDHVTIAFSGLDGSMIDEFPNEDARLLAETLSATLSCDAESGALNVALPLHLEGSGLHGLKGCP